jgi:UDP-N-acetylglucosamine transferase subunit ALG13
MTEKRRRNPPVRTGRPTGFQIPYDLLEWLDAHCERLNTKLANRGLSMTTTRTDVVITALRQYQAREKKSAKRAETTSDAGE